MRNIIWAALLVVAGCAPTNGRTDGASGEGPPDPRMIQVWKTEFFDYAAALALTRSDNPQDRARGLERAAGMAPYEYFGWLKPGDQELIAKARQGDAAAMKELGRRAEVLDAVIVFTRPYNGPAWEVARKRIVKQGPDMAQFMGQLLVNFMLQSKYRDHYGELRRHLVETGEPGMKILIATTMTWADYMQDTPIGKHEELTQLLAALAMFGKTGAEGIEAASRSPKRYVRTCLVRAIAEVRGLEHLDIVRRLLIEDEDWEVRSAAAESLGNLRGGERSCEALMAALKSEAARPPGKTRGDETPGIRSAFVLQKIVFGLGRANCAEAIPNLIAALDFIDRDAYEIQERAAEALYDITGERIPTKEGWIKWYRTTYPKWKAEREKRDK